MRIDDVLDHPNADRLSLNKIRGFVAVSNKTVDHAQGESQVDFVHRYKAGDLVIYVPEGAVVPDRLLQRYGYWDEEKQKGILAGSKGNRVKAVKLRGIISQGLIFPADYQGNRTIVSSTLSEPVTFRGICTTTAFEETDEDGNTYTVSCREGTDLISFEGDNVANYLGITKYEPEVPAAMDGQLIYNPDFVVKFDIENAQKYPTVFQDAENVYVTEKLHGTFTGIVFTQHPVEGFDRIDMNGMDISYGAFSKGCGAKGFTFAMTQENVIKNVYCKQAVALAYMPSVQRTMCRTFFTKEGELEFIAVLGETFGKGVQDLTYSTQKANFAAFSVVFKYIDGTQRYLDRQELVQFLSETGIPMVPFLYSGPYSEDKMIELRDGKSAIDNVTVREGIVIVPECEGRNDEIGRRVLKMVSPDYLTRKGGTEYS
jgi:RNA ligase (TIGR02306 family)